MNRLIDFKKWFQKNERKFEKKSMMCFRSTGSIKYTLFKIMITSKKFSLGSTCHCWSEVKKRLKYIRRKSIGRFPVKKDVFNPIGRF